MDALRTGLVDPDDVPPVPDEADLYVNPGEWWALGDHRLLCGDGRRARSIAVGWLRPRVARAD